MRAIGIQHPLGVAIVEAALILEAGAGDHFDRMVVVTCNPEQRAVRFAARQKVDLESARKEVARRMAAQLPDEEKIKAADFVIDNSGTLENTREQAGRVWQQLKHEAELSPAAARQES
jgi:dephospho-CoA kinase